MGMRGEEGIAQQRRHVVVYTGATRCNDDSVAQGPCLDVPAFKVGEARQRVDASLGWENASKRFGVGLIVNNLLDRRYVNSVSYQTASIGAPYATISAPRCWC